MKYLNITGVRWVEPDKVPNVNLFYNYDLIVFKSSGGNGMVRMENRTGYIQCREKWSEKEHEYFFTAPMMPDKT